MENLDKSLFQRIRGQIMRGEPASLTVEAEGECRVRRFLPRQRLIILGGGHVAAALCAFASRLDFSVTVCDDRPAFANSLRFPTADRVICDSFARAVRGLALRETDYVCVMTRGHRWDRECLDAVFAGPQPCYLGMLGSHRRSAGLKQALLADGAAAERVSALHAPIGLPIGAVTPEEIAVSVCAELIGHRHAAAEKTGAGVLDQTNADQSVLDVLAEPDRPCALLLVLSVSGSAPAKSGAMMAVDRLGATAGTIGGGCGEAAAMARARRLIGTGSRTVISVDLTNEEAAQQGLACGGTMKVFLADVTTE